MNFWIDWRLRWSALTLCLLWTFLESMIETMLCFLLMRSHSNSKTVGSKYFNTRLRFPITSIFVQWSVLQGVTWAFVTGYFIFPIGPLFLFLLFLLWPSRDQFQLIRVRKLYYYYFFLSWENAHNRWIS